MCATGSQEQSSDRCTNQSRRGGVCARHEEGGIPRQPAMKDVEIKGEWEVRYAWRIKDCKEAENGYIKL